MHLAMESLSITELVLVKQGYRKLELISGTFVSPLSPQTKKLNWKCLFCVTLLLLTQDGKPWFSLRFTQQIAQELLDASARSFQGLGKH